MNYNNRDADLFPYHYLLECLEILHHQWSMGTHTHTKATDLLGSNGYSCTGHLVLKDLLHQ